MHACKSLLFQDEKTWVKKNNQSLLDVTMGSYDGSEVCKLSEKFGKENVGLYWDDGLMLLKRPGKRSAVRARKSLHSIFHQFGLKIKGELNNQIVNFLDVTFNFQEGKYSVY